MNKSRILFIDFGRRRSGLAISDREKKLAFPSPPLVLSKRESGKGEEIVRGIACLVNAKNYFLEEIIVGDPRLLNGKRSSFGEKVVQWTAYLHDYFPAIKIILWDERFSSVQAERSLREMGKSRRERVQYTDSTAAALLLQSYLDAKRESLHMNVAIPCVDESLRLF